MADASFNDDGGDRIMYSLQPFLENKHETAHSTYADDLSLFNAQYTWEDRARTSMYTNQIAQSRSAFYSGQTLGSGFERPRLERQSSIVDGLLSEIYDRWHDHKQDSFDSDTFTECSSTSEVMHWRNRSYFHDSVVGVRQLGRLHPALLQEYSITELKNLVGVLSRFVNQMSAKLVRQLKRRERRMSKVQNNCDIVTAIIQASSPKRRIDTRMRFTVEPSQGDSAFEQWKDAMKAVARLPLGIPDEFRKKVWLSLADQHIHDLKIDWDKTVKIAFNERSNPDDNKLGLQIVKDLHRTGCSGFSGEDNEEERALLKRILLAYARWNKAVGYCQGFNVIAALLLDVMDRKEADAFKVMIYLIDHVLPQSYFANNLRALSVDMAVFRDLLKIFPKLSKHLDYLQHAQDQMSGGCYEPPLTNVFTMQWFLTLFATCLPKATTLRVWDAIMLDGSEILLRTALVIWGKLSSRILTVSTADEFYTLMGDITQEMMEGHVLDADSMIKSIYSIAPFPFPQLTELREKYTYNIRPFTPANKRNWADGSVLPSDEDDLEDDDIEAITCFTGFIPTTANMGGKLKALEGDQRSASIPDISSLGPGAYGLGPAEGNGLSNTPAYMERMSTDINALKKQYVKLRQRQRQAHIILTTASAKQQAQKIKPMMPAIETPRAVNHLFINKHAVKGRNRLVAAGPRIANLYPITGMSSSTQTAVQPGKSQVIGNTKSKWSQKASKADSKSVQMKKTDRNEPSAIEKNENISNNAAVGQSPGASPVNTSASKHEDSEKVIAGAQNTEDNSNSVDNHGGNTAIERDGLCDGISGCDTVSENQGSQSPIVTESVHSQLKENTVISQEQGYSKEESSCNEIRAEMHDNNIRTECSEDIVSEGANSIGAKTVGSEAGKLETADMASAVTGDDVKVITNGAVGNESEKTEIDEVQSDKSFIAEESEQQNDCIEKNVKTTEIQKQETAVSHSSLAIDCAVSNTQYALTFPSKSGCSGKKSPSSAVSHDKSFEQYYNNKRNLTTNRSQSVDNGLKKFTTSKKTFNPFPVLHMNQNRAKTGVRLGLYKQSTLEEFEKNLKGQTVWGK